MSLFIICVLARYRMMFELCAVSQHEEKHNLTQNEEREKSRETSH